MVLDRGKRRLRRASNWHLGGKTTGEGLARKGKLYTTTPKLIFTMPLQKDFRSQLCKEYLTGRIDIWRYHIWHKKKSRSGTVKKILTEPITSFSGGKRNNTSQTKTYQQQHLWIHNRWRRKTGKNRDYDSTGTSISDSTPDTTQASGQDSRSEGPQKKQT